ncbi:18790_t:CDS:10 [Funneliformis geosporum]|uniref:18790_t:CDS:1 n=1 Tax=Funneliformis geosporum TaxID=1117311 RepID=A0A9W4WX60_9GLOM|nr:18790_t:CDS:10 [Funneliformis geosporum]
MHAYREEILTPKPPPIIRNAGCFIETLYDYKFISNEDAKRLPTLAELENQLEKKNKIHKEGLIFISQDEIQGGEDDPKDLDKKFAGVPSNEFINILLSAKSEKEVAKKVKEEYKAEDKGSPEWKEYIKTVFEKKEIYEAGMTKERIKKILNAIDDDRFLIRVKFVRDNSSNDGRYNYAFKIIDKYQPIQESKRAGKKLVPGGLNVILTKKTKPSFWVGIDGKFLVRIIQGEKLSEYIELNANAVVYEFKREYGLTSTYKQKISIWEKRIRQPDAQVEDVAELEKILKRSIKLLDIPQETIFNSVKYRTVEYYNGNAWKTINKALQEDGRTFRTWMKYIDIIKACKKLFEDAVDWQFQEGIINKERKQESLESLKIVELAEQVFGANHAGSKLASEINDWHPTLTSMHKNIKQSCVEHGHGECWNASNYQVEDQFLSSMENILLVEVVKDMGKQKIEYLLYFYDIFSKQDISCAIIGKFTQGNKVEEKCLTHWIIIDEGELDFLIQNCIKEGTYAAKQKTSRLGALQSSQSRNSADNNPWKNTNRVVTKKTEFTNLDINKVSEPIREIQPGQWCDKGEKIHDPDPNVVYWPKNRHWESIKNITESTAPSIRDPITRWNSVGEQTSERMEEKIFPQVVIWDESDLFCETLPVTEKWEYLEAEWKPSDHMLADKKVIDWELEYAITIHTSQGMTLKASQCVWVIDENLAWDNLIYLAVGRVEYLSQLIWVETPSLPPKIA